MAVEDTEHAAVGDQIKSLRLRKVYIKLRIPRVRAEIAAIAAQKKALNESGAEPSPEIVHERVYSNQHLLALRAELASLEEERKSVLQALKESKSSTVGPA